MKHYFETIKKFFKGFSRDPFVPPEFEISSQIRLIRQSELNCKPEPGRRIHAFEFMEFELSLDLELTGTYRLAAFMGREKKYSFSIACKPGDYEELARGIKESTDYLSGERKISELPINELIRGYYFGV